jgi:hypothetical protein
MTRKAKVTNMRDPTREEMIDAINEECAGLDLGEFDIEAGIYWFATAWHGGQGSNLYSVLCNSEFCPGPMATMDNMDDMTQIVFDALCAEFTDEIR